MCLSKCALAGVLLSWISLLSCGGTVSMQRVSGGEEVSDTQQILVTFRMQPVSLSTRAGSSPKIYHPAAAYRQSVLDDQQAERIARTYGLQKQQEWPIHVLSEHCVVFAVPSRQPLETLLRRLRADKAVASAQSMHYFKVQSERYNDPYRKLQHNITSLQIESAHRIAKGKNIKLALIDSGVDLNHPDLRGKISHAVSFVPQQPVMSGDIHGTAVAGVIAAAVNNRIGIVGISPDVEIWALQACWQIQTHASEALCNSFTLTQAISHALEREAHVLNLSLSGPEDPLLQRLLQAALAQGIIVIAAYDKEQSFAAAIPGIITVAASETYASEALEEKRLYAPGFDILTTLPGGHYDFLSGNSFAAGQVSALTALLLERQRKLSTEQVYAALQRSGRAQVNACFALAQLNNEYDCTRE